MAAADLAIVALALSPGLRAFAVRRRRELALAALLLAILGAPLLTRFRVADRKRALTREYTAHQTSVRYLAPGWGWLDKHGGTGNVATVHSPNNYFAYPAMGPRLERDARYVNVNEADLPYAINYPRCQPRVDPSPQAWVANLMKKRTRWVHLSRYPQVGFPPEGQWTEAMPQLFALRFADATNRVYEFLPVARQDAAGAE
jgi:hypothetical protein